MNAITMDDKERMMRRCIGTERQTNNKLALMISRRKQLQEEKEVKMTSKM